MRNVCARAFGALLVVLLVGVAAQLTPADGAEVVIHPTEYPHALRNPLKGFRPNTNPQAFDHEYATLTRCYLRWNELENDESDDIERILRVCNERWRGVEKHNIKVIPRVYLDWDKKPGNEYWPADMQTHDYSSEQFKRRARRLVRRLGRCWDDDPRVAWVQMGIIGYWGEHHHPAPDAEMQKLLGNAFTEAFQNTKVTVRHPWEFTDYEFGVYWDSWAHTQQMDTHGQAIAELNAEHGRWKVCPIGGECAYNWGRYREQPGDNPSDSLLDPHHRGFLIDSIRRLHGSNLGWVANYDRGDPLVRAGAEQVQKAFGYRFVIDEVRYPRRISHDKPFAVRFALRNIGSTPFYYRWPIEVSLFDPTTREVAWSDTFDDVDIRTWLPGDEWSSEEQMYLIRPPVHEIAGEFELPSSVPQGAYILALAILDPAGMLPAARFAIENYFTGGRHPVGRIGVDCDVADPRLPYSDFDDPADDRTLRYTLSTTR